MIEEENKSGGNHFDFHFHMGFDLYVAVRCGKKEAFDKLVLAAAHPEDPVACGYLSMSLARSENSAIPKDISRAKDLSKHFIPLVLEMVNHCTTSNLADAFYVLAFCYQEGKNDCNDNNVFLKSLAFYVLSQQTQIVDIFQDSP